MKEQIFNSKKIFLSGMSIAFSILLITGCSTTNPAVNSEGTISRSTTTSTGSSTDTNFAQKELAGLKFSKVSDKNSALLSNQTNTAQAPTQAPIATGVATATDSTTVSAPSTGAVAPTSVSTVGGVSADSATSSRLAYPSYGGYFPSAGPFEEYVMIDYEEAKAEGYTGTYLDTYNKKVKPVISAWSADARHTSSNGSTNDVGLNQSIVNTTTPNYYSPYQWQYTFSSASKKEVYSILVSSNETLILRQKWIIKNLNLNDIKIDSNAAIKIYTDKIADTTAKSPDNQDQYQYTGAPNTEILYKLPDQGTWYFYLSQEKSGLVWNINLNFNNNYYGGPVPLAQVDTVNATTSVNTPGVVQPSFSPPQPVDRIYYSGGYARINAQTGEVLSFSRPTKYTEKYYPYPTPYTKCDSQGNCYSEGSSGGGTTSVSVPPASTTVVGIAQPAIAAEPKR